MLTTRYPLTDLQWSGALLAAVDSDGQVRELGRFGLVGANPSSEPIPLFGSGVVSKALQTEEPVLVSNLAELAEQNQIAPGGDIDELARINQLKSAFIIPLHDRGYIYGVLGLVSTTKHQDIPEFQIPLGFLQSAFSLAIRALTSTVSSKQSKGIDLRQFSPRELEILQLLEKEKTNQEIANELHVSIHTVKVGVSSILAKSNSITRKDVALKIRYGRV